MNFYNPLFLFIFFILSLNSCAQDQRIEGVWDVKNNYYQAVYEIEENENKYYGKVHYYNDGTTAYKGDNKEKDYFLTDIEFKDGKYINGKMYLPDGSFYNVIFTLKNENTLEVLMTIENQPYTEIWTRNTTY